MKKIIVLMAFVFGLIECVATGAEHWEALLAASLLAILVMMLDNEKC